MSHLDPPPDKYNRRVQLGCALVFIVPPLLLIWHFHEGDVDWKLGAGVAAVLIGFPWAVVRYGDKAWATALKLLTDCFRR